MVAGAEPELVPVPPAGKRPLGGRRGEHAPGVGVDGPGPAQPLRRDHPAGAAGAIRNQPAVQQHLAEPGHVAGGGAQAPVVHGGAQAVVQQEGVVFGPHRCPDQLGDQLGHGQAGRALAHPAQHVGLGRTVQEPLAVRRLGLQRGQEPVEPAGLALAGLPFDPLVQAADVRVRVGVLLQEPDPAAHVVDVPDQGAGVAAASQFGNVTRDLGVGVEQAAVDEHGGHAADDGLGHRHQRVRPVRRAQRAVPLGDQLPVLQHQVGVGVGIAEHVAHGAGRRRLPRPVHPGHRDRRAGRAGRRRQAAGLGCAVAAGHPVGGQEVADMPERPPVGGRILPVECRDRHALDLGSRLLRHKPNRRSRLGVPVFG